MLAVGTLIKTWLPTPHTPFFLLLLLLLLLLRISIPPTQSPSSFCSLDRCLSSLARFLFFLQFRRLLLRFLFFLLSSMESLSTLALFRLPTLSTAPLLPAPRSTLFSLSLRLKS